LSSNWSLTLSVCRSKKSQFIRIAKEYGYDKKRLTRLFVWLLIFATCLRFTLGYTSHHRPSFFERFSAFTEDEIKTNEEVIIYNLRLNYSQLTFGNERIKCFLNSSVSPQLL
jgi:hypothetical protein